ncbi:MAG: nucleoside deaminase, partial [Pseudomonadota bacterium]
GAVESGVRFFSQASCHHRPEVYGGIAAEESASLMQSFFATRRSC